jgi:hypothetical protein
MALIIKPTNLALTWASTGVKLEPVASKVAAGWVVENPPYQYDNWLNNRQDTFNAHINQTGIPHWDATTEYIGNKSYCQDSDGVVYKALVTNTNVVPSNPLNSAKWVKAFEDFGSVAVVTAALDTHVTKYGTLDGLVNQSTARNNLSVFSKAESDVRFAAFAGTVGQTFHVGNATLATHAINKAQLDAVAQQATEVVIGVTRIASQTTMNVGTNDTDTVTALKGTATFNRRDKNLSDVGNVVTARTNLGLTITATTSLADIVLKADNLAGLVSVAAARTNLGLGDMAVATQLAFMRKDANLAGLADTTVSRANLGLNSMAVENTINWLSKAGNLAGIVDAPAARINLGLGSISTRESADFLDKAGNLAGLTNQQSARNNLGLQSLAMFNTNGTSPANVAANTLDFSGGSVLGVGYHYLPNDIVEQYGIAAISENTRVVFATPMIPFNVQLTVANVLSTVSIQERTTGIGAIDNNGFNAWAAFPGGVATLAVHWRAIGQRIR